MKISPLDFLLGSELKMNKKFYFISGNEITLMKKIYNCIFEKYKKKGNITLSKIDSIENFKSDIGLFDNKKLYFVKDCNKISKENLDVVRENDGVFIFVQENSSKTKRVKNIFLKDRDSYLVDCYELDKDSKIKILNNFLNANNIEIEKDIFWFLVDKLDNRFMFLEDSLNKLLRLQSCDITINNVKKILTIDSVGKEKLFFSIFNKNANIVKMYREKILSTSDVNELYYYCKMFCQNIIDSENEVQFAKKIPIYLFRQKNFLLELFKKYNYEKKKQLLGLLILTEINLRKENSLSLITGLRFLLRIKKISTS